MAGKVKWKALAVFCFLSYMSVNGDSSAPEGCQDVCDKTYPLHTYPKIENSRACKRGCRLFSVLGFLENGDSTLVDCKQECSNAYKADEAVAACHLGCQSQHSKAQNQQPLLENSAEQPFHIRIFSPLFSMNRVFGDIIDQMNQQANQGFGAPNLQAQAGFLGVPVPEMPGRGNGVSMSWSTYMENNNGKMTIVKSPPQIQTFGWGPQADSQELGPGEENIYDVDHEYVQPKPLVAKNGDCGWRMVEGKYYPDAPEYGSMFFYDGDVQVCIQKCKNTPGCKGFNHDRRNLCHLFSKSAQDGIEFKDSNDLDHYEMRNCAEGVDSSSSISITNSLAVPEGYDEEVDLLIERDDSSYDWLGCLSFKSGVPRWILMCIIMFSALALIFLCFASTSSRKKKYQKLVEDGSADANPYIISQDKSLVWMQPTKVALASVHGQEAGPLPLKVPVEKI